MSVFVDATATGAAASAQPERAQLKQTARQFEAMLLRQMLAAARKTDFGGDELFGSEAMGTFRQMQDDRSADIVADTGCLGLATMIEAQLARFLPASDGSR